MGFVARPVGGIIIGHYGDKIGRKSMLVLTLVIMGVATFLIGLLPTYEQIGPWAPVALVVLRLAQGFGVGGEWGGAVLMAVEHAPPGKRGFYGSWPQIGVPAGLLLSNGVFSLLLAPARGAVPRRGAGACRSCSASCWSSSACSSACGSSRRRRSRSIKETSAEARQPIVEVLRTYPKQVLLAMGARFAENGALLHLQRVRPHLRHAAA